MSADFTDAHGIKHTIEINLSTLERIQNRFSVNLLEMVSGDLATRLSQDLPLLMNIIGELAFPGLDDRTVAGLLAQNEVIVSAVDALIAAVQSYLTSRVRQLMAPVTSASAVRAPKTFRNRRGELFEIEFLLSTAERLKKEGVDVWNLESLRNAVSNPSDVAKLLWWTLGSPGQLLTFTEGFTLQTVEDGLSALVEALGEFLPSRLALPLLEAHRQAQKLSDAIYTRADSIIREFQLAAS